ncbi:hypothetical protein D0962_18830 [Leptolyngbyaceae cyanobacterium CCMR0082]|uniref:Uncharacterized protein n=1 Tax=Adonisia turfae CCMR0082 TaxID=2304604 RepID=A0A6M0S8Z2_9CYAN|nr:hypothetical protein [Adonisia turfae]NEZ64816.1 hypothetical protein [Adonisia turfae CCMR0082]
MTLVTTAPDTVPATHENLAEKAELKYSRMPITVAMHDLIRAWSEGLINDDAYIFFALQIERIGKESPEEFDVTQFVEDWLGYGKSDKPKRLKESKVTAYVQKLQQMGAAHVEIKMQLSLDI